MKKLANEYEIILTEDFVAKVEEIERKKDEEIAELKAKLAEILPEQYGKVDATPPYKSWGKLVPGSDEAYAEGCKCPILDNQEMPDHKKWVNGDCPLHGIGTPLQTNSKETLEW
jgi:hypothetical protein